MHCRHFNIDDEEDAWGFDVGWWYMPDYDDHDEFDGFSPFKLLGIDHISTVEISEMRPLATELELFLELRGFPPIDLRRFHYWSEDPGYDVRTVIADFVQLRELPITADHLFGLWLLTA